MSYPQASTSTTSQSTQSPSTGSQTMTVSQRAATNIPSNQHSGTETGTVGVIRLRGTRHVGPRVAWDEDVVDNEHMGKKKSKICCIYHKPRAFDESSSDESSSDESSDSECGHHHHHNHRRQSNSRKHGVDGEPGGTSGPNAYERQSSKKGKAKS